MSFYDSLKSVEPSQLTCMSSEFETRHHTNNVRDQKYKTAVIQKFRVYDQLFKVKTNWSNGEVIFLSPERRVFDLTDFLDQFSQLNQKMINEQPIKYEPPRKRVFDDEEDFRQNQNVVNTMQKEVFEPDFIPMEFDNSYKLTEMNA